MYFVAVVGLSLLSSVALAITIWTSIDFWREQEIVSELLVQLPAEAKDSARYLAGELRWQFRLTTLVVLNVVVTGIGVILLWRSYRQSQSSLRDMQTLASDILGSLEEAVLTSDRQGNLTSINPRGLKLLKVGESSLHRPLVEITAVPLDVFRRRWLQDRTIVMPQEFTLDNNGNLRTLRVFCQGLSDHMGREQGTVLLLRDVTESKLVEQRMRRMESFMGLGLVAAGLHHEIKNPLTALSLHFQLLEESLLAGGTSDENRQTLVIIRSELLRIGEVLETFRDFASIDRLDLTKLNLNELAERQVQLISPQTEAQHVRLIFLPFETAIHVEADRVRLEQSLLNLLLNAMQAMPNGGTLTVRTYSDENKATIEIADTGHGIPTELQDKIMEPYFSTKSGGTGMGLALCDKIIREHAGVLDFHTSSQGTTFCITLPIGP
jgi:signal transduction histidine kinase